MCNKRSTHIYHKSYSKDVLNGTNTKSLVCVCNKCYRTIKFNKDGSERRLDKSNQALYRLLNPRRRKSPCGVCRNLVWATFGYSDLMGNKHNLCTKCYIRATGLNPKVSERDTAGYTHYPSNTARDRRIDRTDMTPEQIRAARRGEDPTTVGKITLHQYQTLIDENYDGDTIKNWTKKQAQKEIDKIRRTLLKNKSLRGSEEAAEAPS